MSLGLSIYRSDRSLARTAAAEQRRKRIAGKTATTVKRAASWTARRRSFSVSQRGRFRVTVDRKSPDHWVVQIDGRERFVFLGPTARLLAERQANALERRPHTIPPASTEVPPNTRREHLTDAIVTNAAALQCVEEQREGRHLMEAGGSVRRDRAKRARVCCQRRRTDAS